MARLLSPPPMPLLQVTNHQANSYWHKDSKHHCLSSYLGFMTDDPQVWGIATVFEGSKTQIYWFDTRRAKEYL
jgi:hypothetical protein